MRRLSLLIHRWVGLALAALLVLLGVTGSVLVYEREIDRALNPELLRVEAPGGSEGAAARGARAVEGPDGPGAVETRITPGAALAAVREWGVEPGAVEQIVMPRHPTDPYILRVSPERADDPRREVTVDPYTGRVLGARPEGSGVVGVLFRLHTDLFAGALGDQIVGWSGVLLLLLSATGLVVWWPRLPRWPRFREALVVKTGAGPKRTNYDLHRAGGFWTALYVTVLAATGAGLIFYTAAGRILNAATGSEAPPPPPASTAPPVAPASGPGENGAPDTGGNRVPDPRGSAPPDGLLPALQSPEALDAAWREAEAALPGAVFTFLSLGGPAEAPVSFRARMPSELHPNGRSYVFFDRWTGERLGAHDASRLGPGPKLLHALYPVHIGAFALGPLGPDGIRALWALLGLAPGVLAVTGFLVWWWRGNGSTAGPPGR